MRATSSTPRPILVMRVEESLLKSTSVARNFIGVLDRMSMKLQRGQGMDLQALKVKREYNGDSEP
eukprot:1157701-Pelagomonas_calceolata.AAC.4